MSEVSFRKGFNNFAHDYPRNGYHLPLLKVAKNIKQKIFYELPNGFLPNICHSDAFTIFLM